MLDGKIAAGKDCDFDSDQYLAWQGHLTRNLVKLGIDRQPVRPPSLAEDQPLC
jgi:hypothetical protein